MAYTLPNGKGVYPPNGIVDGHMASVHISLAKLTNCASISDYRNTIAVTKF